jgi:hypothetical protein
MPFLQEIYEEEIPPETGGNNESGRNKNIGKGATMIICRWPKDVTMMALAFAAATVITAATVLFIFAFKNRMAHELVTKKEMKFLDLETRCDYKHAEDAMVRKLTRLRRKDTFNSVGFQHTSSFETERDDNSIADLSVSTEHRAFFVTADEHLSSRQLCAIESAARVMPDYNLYVIILSINNTDVNSVPDKRFGELSNLYPKVKIYRLKGDKYFYDSPMRGILHKSNFSSSLIVFAARVLTLWRYGGITYNLDLITLDNAYSRTYPVPVDNTVMISRNGGAVMSVAIQCHEFLYRLMKSLTSLYGKRHGSYELCSKDVLQYTLKEFCKNGNKKSGPGTRLHKKYFNNCDGISAMPHCLICKEEEESNTNCIWTSSAKRNHNLLQNFCPVSYRQRMSEQTLHPHITAVNELWRHAIH